MKINDFKLEKYFEKYELTTPYPLTQSDCESMTTKELLAMEPGSEEGLLNLWLGYGEIWGDPELRDVIANSYKDMIADNVLVIHGAQEGIFAYMNVMLDPGDHMVVMYPNYQSTYEVANTIPGCEFSKWYVRDDGEKWTVDFDELESLIKPNTKIIAVCSPHNPTGYTFTNNEIDKLCDICRKHDLYLFCDEVYKGLEHDGEKRDSVADHYKKALVVNVTSKAYGLGGLRVGWLVSKDKEILKKLVKFKQYMSICDSVPSEYLTKIAIRNRTVIHEKSRKLIEKNMLIADAFFDRHSNLFEKKSINAGPIAFHKLLSDMPVEEFCQLAVDKKGVMLLPSSIYDMDYQYFRMSYGRKNFEENLKKFEEFLYEEGFAE